MEEMTKKTLGEMIGAVSYTHLIWLQYAINAIHQKIISQAENYIIGNRSFQILKALPL